MSVPKKRLTTATDNFVGHCQYVLTTVSPHFWRLAGLTILPVRFAKKTVLVLVFLSVLPVLLAKFTRTDKIASPSVLPVLTATLQMQAVCLVLLALAWAWVAPPVPLPLAVPTTAKALLLRRAPLTVTLLVVSPTTPLTATASARSGLLTVVTRPVATPSVAQTTPLLLLV